MAGWRAPMLPELPPGVYCDNWLVLWIQQFPIAFSKGSRHKKNLNVNFFQKGLHFEILSFGKFQVAKWASGMKRLFKASFMN